MVRQILLLTSCWALASCEYAVRDPFHIGYRVPVQLADGQHVEVETLSNFSTGLPVFYVQDLLSEEECSAIRSAAPRPAMMKSLVAREYQRVTKKRAARHFRDVDVDRDQSLDGDELAQFFKEAADLVDFTWDFLSAYLPKATAAAGDRRQVSQKEFISTDWVKFFRAAKKHHPDWFARHSYQTFVEYSDHAFLQPVLDKVAAVTGLSKSLVRRTAESMQVLLYPEGGHYSCHHDTAPDNPDFPRFLTLFFFLNDVDGGETVFFGTDLNGTYPEDRFAAGEDVWGPIESKCQSVRSCPGFDGSSPFASSLVVKPRAGSAVFWYNMAVTNEGHVGRFYWSSIHGGCPSKGEKWAANIWLHAAHRAGQEL
ncbi:unnamed protein product [Effrenium voratum]|uniref:Fe2OG dioxygenase domain-containing protein n=1 Tax=Effrenium voratum TaxID=2562239 RepID=A0AA36J7J4_9DINO|nr:unnamed protein product [Effrenium voratum]